MNNLLHQKCVYIWFTTTLVHLMVEFAFLGCDLMQQESLVDSSNGFSWKGSNVNYIKPTIVFDPYMLLSIDMHGDHRALAVGTFSRAIST